MSNHTEFYKAVIDQITPELFGINDDITQKTLNKYKSKDQIKKLLAYIKAHMNDTHVNNNDPVRPLYVEDAMLLMASRPCFKTFDTGLAIIIHDQNKENKINNKVNNKKSQPFSYDVRVTFELDHTRRFLIMILQSIAHGVLDNKDTKPLFNCLKALIKHGPLFKWLFMVTMNTSDLDELDNFNTAYQITKLGINMLNHLNVYSYSTPILKLPLTYAERSIISETLFKNAFNSTHAL